MNRIVLFALAALCLSACKKNAPVVAGEEAPLVTRNTPTQVPEAPANRGEVPDDVKQLMKNFERVYFDTNSVSLSKASQVALNANAEIMQKAVDIRVEVQGHADERGTTDFNVALGQRRAEAVTRYLNKQGVSQERFTTVSYGEERPSNAGSGEAAWTANRRAEFRVTWGRGPRGTVN